MAAETKEITEISYDRDWGMRSSRRLYVWYIEGKLTKQQALKFVADQLGCKPKDVKNATDIRAIEFGKRYDFHQAGGPGSCF